MPFVSYPGVYVEELPSGVRTIAGVGTSITAFVGRAQRGPVNTATRIQSFGDYERAFGGLWYDSTMSYAVYHYFLNGGTDAVVIRVVEGTAVKSGISFTGTHVLNLVAKSEGFWGRSLSATVDHNIASGGNDVFNLTIKYTVGGIVVATETFLNVSVLSASTRFVSTILENESQFMRVTGSLPAQRPAIGNGTADNLGTDGADITDALVVGSQSARTGIYALENVDLFNMLCLPPLKRTGAGADIATGTWSSALTYCKARRAMLIVDSPASWTSASTAVSGITGLNLTDENALIYFPRILAADAARGGLLDTFAPSGAVAGVIARTDGQRGIWKAAAGIDATINGAQGFNIKLTEGEIGTLNPVGINSLRSLPAAGNVVWGARTIEGADRLASEWKYAPVRRTALYIEESLYRGTQWAVFEPNDEPLWSQIRLNVGAFMNNLFRQGAFQGTSTKEAYFVKCDKETTTQNDINLGVVNIIVGFAPLKPAEFVIIKLQQIAGKIDT